MHRRGYRTAAAAAAMATVWLVIAAPAAVALDVPYIDDGMYDPRKIPVPGADLQDSRGVELWRYDMFLNDDETLKPSNNIAGALIRTFWGIYRVVAGLSIWLIDWVLEFGWVSFLATPVTEIGDGLAQIVARLGLTTALLTITAFICGMWMLRGRWSLGLYELAAAAVIASLASGLLSNPVGLVTGPDGYIMGSRDIGFQLADGLVNGPNHEPFFPTGSPNQDDNLGPVRPPDEQEAFTRDLRILGIRTEQTARMIDTLVRGPHQALNFGTILDGTECEDRYDALLRSNPIVDVSRDQSFWDGLLSFGDGGFLGFLGDTWELPRRNPAGHALAECNPVAMAPADNPSWSQVSTAFIIAPGAFIILIFAALLAGAVLIAGINVLYQSLKAIVTLVTALLPGRGRGALWQTVADIVVSLLILIFAIVFLSAYLLLVDAVLRTQEDVGAATTFIVVDIVLLAGLIVFWRARKSLRRASERLAQAFASRPGGAPTQLPEQTAGRDLRRGVRRAAGLAGISTYGILKLRRHRRKNRGPGRGGEADPGNDPDPGDDPDPAPHDVELERVDRDGPGPRRRAITDGRPIVAGPGPERCEITRGWRSAGPGRPRRALPPGPSGARGSDPPSPSGGPPGKLGRGRRLAGRLLGGGVKAAAAAATGGASTTVTAAISAAQATRRARLASRLANVAARASGRAAGQVTPGQNPRPARPSARQTSARATTAARPAPTAGYRRVVTNGGQAVFVPDPAPDPRTEAGRGGGPRALRGGTRRAARERLQSDLARARGRG